jgi:hypothetical protein
VTMRSFHAPPRLLLSQPDPKVREAQSWLHVWLCAVCVLLACELIPQQLHAAGVPSCFEFTGPIRVAECTWRTCQVCLLLVSQL